MSPKKAEPPTSPKKGEPPTSPPRDRKNNKGENKHKNRKVGKDGAVPESPSKKQRREDAKKKAEGVNAEYFGHLDKALKTITSKWKDIVSADPLPMVPANKGDMRGFTAAYDSDVFDAQFKQDGVCSRTPAVSTSCGRTSFTRCFPTSPCTLLVYMHTFILC